jgi:AcrR family transcriptional regulator
MRQLPEYLSPRPVGRERISRQALSQHQRERLLDSAAGVFAKRGYTEATIDNIVAAAKASVGSFYGLFENKLDCFLAVHERIVADARERIEAAISAEESWGGRAALGLHELLEIFVAAPLDGRISLIEVQTAGPTAIDRYNAMMDEAVEWLSEGRLAYPAAAELPPTFEQAAVGGFTYFLQQQLLASKQLMVEPLFRDTVQMVLVPIVGFEEAQRLSGDVASSRGK